MCLGVPAFAKTNSSDVLLGNMGGLRDVLERYGATLDLSETSEELGNTTGGLRRGFKYAGLTRMALTLDAKKALGWNGGTFHVSALQIHGSNLSKGNLDALQTISNIDADRATRLWQLWYRQKLGPDADVKIGQQSIDHDFIVSRYAGVFINAMNGWPALPSVDLYAGGPVYPLSSLGVRLRVKPNGHVTVLAGAFDDNPPGGSFSSDSQVRDGEASGTRFNLGTGTLLLGEIQDTIPRPPFAGRSSDLPGTYKLGVWADTGTFPDQRFDPAGVSLAAPGSTGSPRLDRGNLSIYGVADQMVWRPDRKGPQLIGVFFRAMGAPGDRNLVDFALNAGIDLRAPSRRRPHDQVGIAYGVAHIGPSAAALDRDREFFSGMQLPVRSAEQIVEVTYRRQLTPWWQLQPDVQYVFDPAGGSSNPLAPTQRIGNELVLGLRAHIRF